MASKVKVRFGLARCQPHEIVDDFHQRPIRRADDQNGADVRRAGRHDRRNAEARAQDPRDRQRVRQRPGCQHDRLRPQRRLDRAMVQHVARHQRSARGDPPPQRRQQLRRVKHSTIDLCGSFTSGTSPTGSLSRHFTGHVRPRGRSAGGMSKIRSCGRGRLPRPDAWSNQPGRRVIQFRPVDSCPGAKVCVAGPVRFCACRAVRAP